MEALFGMEIQMEYLMMPLRLASARTISIVGSQVGDVKFVDLSGGVITLDDRTDIGVDVPEIIWFNISANYRTLT